MMWSEYQRQTISTAIYPGVGSQSIDAAVYLLLGLAGESSEVLEKVLLQDQEGIIAELGDVSWYLARLCEELNITIPDNIPTPYIE